MQSLISDIKYYSDLSSQGCLMLSHGTMEASTLNGLPCAPQTYIPREPWRLPTEEEKKLLTGNFNDAHIPYQSTGLFRLPDEIIEALKRADINKIQSRNDILLASQGEFFKNAQKLIEKYCERFLIDGHENMVQGLSILPGGHTTVTFNNRENRYIGLHFDSWEQQPLEKRAEAKNRISINLGSGPRYLLYINLQMKTLLQLLEGKHNERDLPLRPNHIVPTFLKVFPDYPVVRLMVNPMEGYIAPTENFIHEGSSVGKTSWDVHLTLRSFYTLKPHGEKLLNKLKKILIFKKN